MALQRGNYYSMHEAESMEMHASGKPWTGPALLRRFAEGRKQDPDFVLGVSPLGMSDPVIYLGDDSVQSVQLEMAFSLSPEKKREEEKKALEEEKTKQAEQDLQKRKQEQNAQKRLQDLKRRVRNPFPDWAMLPFGASKAEVIRFVESEKLSGCKGLDQQQRVDPMMPIHCPSVRFFEGEGVVSFHFETGWLVRLELYVQPSNVVLSSVEQAQPHFSRLFRSLQRYVGPMVDSQYSHKPGGTPVTEADALSRLSETGSMWVTLSPLKPQPAYEVSARLVRDQSHLLLLPSFTFRLIVRRTIKETP